MDTQKATMTIRKINTDASAIDISGDVSAAAENILMDAYTQLSTAGVRIIILNFQNLAYMNSSGIGLLVTLLIRANRNKQRLLAVCLSDHYRQIFELTRLNEAIGIYDTEAEAVNAVMV